MSAQKGSMDSGASRKRMKPGVIVVFAFQPFSCHEFTAVLAFFDVSFSFLFTINRYRKRLEMKQNRRLYLYRRKGLRLTKLGPKKWSSIFLLFLRRLRILLRG